MLKLNLQWFGGRGNGGRSSISLTEGEKIEAAEAYLAGEGFEMNKLARGLPIDEEMYDKADIKRYVKNLEKTIDGYSLDSQKNSL